MNRRYTLLGIVLFLSAFALGGLLGLPPVVKQFSYAMAAGRAQAAREELKGDKGEPSLTLSHTFRNVSKAMAPAVVSVYSVKKARSSPHIQRPPFHGFEHSPFGEFFGNDLFEKYFENRAPQRGQEQRGMGTGVIVNKDGYVLTNNHVIDGADEVSLKLSSGATLKAKVIGTDPKTDLAVLKVSGKDLVAAPLGDSDSLDVGDWVLAMGNPFGLSHTVTAGIVSAKGRADVGIADYEDFIQTDAAINPGNSGGPLVNMKGEVVGINTAIATKTGGYMGIGFAIPINMAKSIMDSLISNGKVERGWMGVMIQNLNEDLAQSFGVQSTEGVLIGDVTPDGPAQKAGLEAGDILISFDGQKMKDMAQLRNTVAGTPPGKTVKIEVIRSGKPKTLTLKIGQLEGAAVASKQEGSPHKLGLTVQTLTPELARSLGTDREKGVVVTSVEPGTPAARAGLRPK